MNSVTLTKGSTVVTIYTSKLDYDITKSWKINPIPSPASSWVETTLSSGASAGASTISVASATGFKAEDTIQISGTETATISSIAGTTFTLKENLIQSHTSGASVIRMGRIISLDFNQVVETITVTGRITASSTKTLEAVAADLKAMSIGGGSIAVKSDLHSFQNAAVTKITITVTPQDAIDPDTAGSEMSYSVIVNLTNSSTAIGET